MSATAIKFGKINTVGFWVLVLASLIFTSDIPYADTISMAGLIIFLAHVGECFIFKTKLNSTNDYIGTLIYGVFHVFDKNR